MLRADLPGAIKTEAVFHLTAGISYPLMIVLATMLLPAMIVRFYQGWFQMLLIDLPLFVASTCSISGFYLASQRVLYPKGWTRTMLYLPFIMAVGIGLSVRNAKAVLEALSGKQSEFARTPKFSIEGQSGTFIKKTYKNRAGWLPWIEIGLGLYFAADHRLRHPERKLPHRSVPLPLRVGLPLHRPDVARPGAFRASARRFRRQRASRRSAPGAHRRPRLLARALRATGLEVAPRQGHPVFPGRRAAENSLAGARLQHARRPRQVGHARRRRRQSQATARRHRRGRTCRWPRCARCTPTSRTSSANRISRADSPSASRGDAAITQHAGVLLSVQTADCVPILLADTKHRVIAAVHAGWRGTLARIAVKTLGRMQQEFGTRPQDVVAALGPGDRPLLLPGRTGGDASIRLAISAAADWFDGPFAPQAEGESQHWLPWLTMMPPGHQPEPERAKLDLRAANRSQLLEAGVAANNIAVSALCTKCRADLFFQLPPRRRRHRPPAGNDRDSRSQSYAGGGETSGKIEGNTEREAGDSMSASCPHAAAMSCPRE